MQMTCMPSEVRGRKTGGGVYVYVGVDVYVLWQWISSITSCFLLPCPQGEPSCTMASWLLVLISHSLSCEKG